ncbi:hypothetical protein [Bifidobacterium apri]|uniref:hypothetical protein n=1 Tax=Bifidobacterium apri TaxID=1769423 RepID=UPI00142EE169|nr:hypothetical protein [Bifidobacterium apri]
MVTRLGRIHEDYGKRHPAYTIWSSAAMTKGRRARHDCVPSGCGQSGAPTWLDDHDLTNPLPGSQTVSTP